MPATVGAMSWGLSTRRGTPCQASAIWSAKSGRFTRCKNHGGTGTGPKDSRRNRAYPASRHEARTVLQTDRKRRQLVSSNPTPRIPGTRFEITSASIVGEGPFRPSGHFVEACVGGLVGSPTMLIRIFRTRAAWPSSKMLHRFWWTSTRLYPVLSPIIG
jgi:hypothetical protein